MRHMGYPTAHPCADLWEFDLALPVAPRHLAQAAGKGNTIAATQAAVLRIDAEAQEGDTHCDWRYNTLALM